ncbi:MAG: YceD family protein [Microthrixaceae bacterium]
MTADPRLRVGVAELRRRPGNRVHLVRDVAVGGLAVTTAEVPEGGVAHLDAVLESLSDGITLTGEVAFPWAGPCRRCLEPTGGDLTVPVREVFKDTPEGGELLALDGDAVELGPVVRDAVVLALPLAPLCAEDCAGPDPEHFPVRSADPQERPADPRWAALADLRFDPEPDDR